MNNFSVANNTNIKDGCVEDRKCTDLLCLAVFLGFLGTMMGCTIWGLKNGDFTKLISPFDGQGAICGYDKNVLDYPNLYLTDLLGSTKEIFASGVCVKTCPTKASRAIVCNSDDEIICNSNSVKAAIYASHEVVGYCIPDLKDLKEQDPNMFKAWNIAFKELTNNPAGRKMQDLYLSSNAIYTSIVMSFVYCILFIYLMSAFAETIAWACIVLTQVGLFAGSGVCIQQYFAYKSDMAGMTLSETQQGT
jgi:F0F1-type ATP synthase assembly protein I